MASKEVLHPNFSLFSAIAIKFLNTSDSTKSPFLNISASYVMHIRMYTANHPYLTR